MMDKFKKGDLVKLMDGTIGLIDGLSISLNLNWIFVNDGSASQEDERRFGVLVGDQRHIIGEKELTLVRSAKKVTRV